MLAKLFGRPESIPAAQQPPRERHRPTLPPVEADQARIDALTALITFGATPKIKPSEAFALIAAHLNTQGVEDPTIRREVQIIGQLEASGWMDPTAKVTYLQSQAGMKSGGKIEVQPIVDAVEALRGGIINTPETYAAIAALYDVRAADLPVEPGVEADVWKGHAPSLEVTIDGRRTAPLAPNRSIPIGNVAQHVRWDRVAVKAALVRNRWATSVVSERVLGKSRLKFEELSSTGISAEARTMLVDFVLNDIEVNGGGVGDVALRIKKAQRNARHAEIVKREAPRRAARSLVTFLSHPLGKRMSEKT